jgi:hypothetical protein
VKNTVSDPYSLKPDPVPGVLLNPESGSWLLLNPDPIRMQTKIFMTKKFLKHLFKLVLHVFLCCGTILACLDPDSLTNLIRIWIRNSGEKSMISFLIKTFRGGWSEDKASGWARRPRDSTGWNPSLTSAGPVLYRTLHFITEYEVITMGGC